MVKRFIFIMLSVLAVSCSRQASVWEGSDMWYEPAVAPAPAGIDVFYLVSTEVLSATSEDGSPSWQTLLSPEDRDAIHGEMAWVERNMFYDGFNLISPYYHQFTFSALTQLEPERFQEIYALTATEACEAFDWYMEHRNGGRPFILAGFSQGAMLCLDILKHMSDEDYSRMVACYSIGYRLSAEDLQHPHIKAATGAADRGVTISFNSSLSREGIWPLVSQGAATCINPVNWKTDATPASFTFEGTANSAWVDPETNVLLVDTDDPDYYHSFYDLAPFFLDAGASKDNLHHWDLLFYPRMIHDNALLRAGR